MPSRERLLTVGLIAAVVVVVVGSLVPMVDGPTTVYTVPPALVVTLVG